jgi:hypothetical protein
MMMRVLVTLSSAQSLPRNVMPLFAILVIAHPVVMIITASDLEVHLSASALE